MSREVEALLDYAGGLETYHRTDTWREPVVAHFRWNVAQMVEQCQRAGVPVILVCPVVNLLDCPPMKWETRPDLSLEERARFEAAWQAAQRATDASESRAALQTAHAIDSEHAGVHFFLGRLAWEAGQWDEAARWLQSAKDLDVCPLRALTSMQLAVREIAAQYQVPLVDADQVFRDLSPHGVVGNQWLVDHVHPTIEGHQVLGEKLCEVCLEQGWLVERDPQWRETAHALVRDYLSGLGEDYFQRGKQRLAGLLLWTQGRAKKIRPE
jgi:tetratricopeptide (TPR) repeat protein